MAYIPKVWVLTTTIDPYDLQWGYRTESQIIGVFSTIEQAREELDTCRMNLEKIDEEDENHIYGDYKLDLDFVGGAHVLFRITEHILDYVN